MLAGGLHDGRVRDTESQRATECADLVFTGSTSLAEYSIHETKACC